MWSLMSEEGVRSPGTEVAGSEKQPDMVLRLELGPVEEPLTIRPSQPQEHLSLWTDQGEQQKETRA